MIIQEVKIIGAYLVSVSFIIVPGIIWYGITFGFTISERAIRKQIETQERVSFDDNGIAYTLPLFETTLFISWTMIEAVIYTDYDSNENARFIFHLTQPPMHTRTEEEPLWINKLFQFSSGNRVTIKDDCRNFQEIPKMLEKYLVHINPVDLNEDHRKGSLLNSKTTIKNNVIKTEEHWRSNNNHETEKVIYDKHNRTFEQIMHLKK